MAATETIRICLERGVLVPFLNARQKEVHDIMRTLFSQEAVWEIEMHNARREARDEGLQEGRQVGRKEEFAKAFAVCGRLALTIPKSLPYLKRSLRSFRP